MTLEDIWEALKRQNPDLCDPEETIIFKSKNLKNLLRQVFDHGAKDTASKQKAADDFKNLGGSNPPDPMGMFNDLFGGGK